MFKQIKYTILGLSAIFFLTSCTTSTKFITIKDKETGKDKLIQIYEQIEVKLINEYNEIYDIEDVIIAYKTSDYNPSTSKVITNSFTSRNKVFNTQYSEFSKNGIEKDIFGNEYMTFRDDAILGILAKEYGMKVLIINKKDNSKKLLDYKEIDINFSKMQKYNLYNGFLHTIRSYEKQLEDK